MSYRQLLNECDLVLKWISDQGTKAKISADQLAEFARPFHHPITAITDFLFIRGHVESFYGNRISATLQGLEFAKKESYVTEFEAYDIKMKPKALSFSVGTLLFLGELL